MKALIGCIPGLVIAVIVALKLAETVSASFQALSFGG